MGIRRQAREAALQALFLSDFLNVWDHETIDFCYDHFGIPKAARLFARKLAHGVVDNIVKINSEITCASEHWSLSRMGRVDRAILRIASFEIVFLEEIPMNVAINEAIEIAKRYGSDESPVFINGVLDRVASTAVSRANGTELPGEEKLASKIEIEKVNQDSEAKIENSLEVDLLEVNDEDSSQFTD